MTRSSRRTPCSGPSCPGRGFGSRKYRSPTTIPTRSNTKACSMNPLSPARLPGVQAYVADVTSATFSGCRGSLVDENLGARGLHHRVEERGDVHRDADAAVRDRVDRDVGVAVDGEDRADEEHRVVHLAERDLDPAWHVNRGPEVAGRRDGVGAAAIAAVVVAAAAR